MVNILYRVWAEHQTNEIIGGQLTWLQQSALYSNGTIWRVAVAGGLAFWVTISEFTRINWILRSRFRVQKRLRGIILQAVTD